MIMHKHIQHITTLFFKAILKSLPFGEGFRLGLLGLLVLLPLWLQAQTIQAKVIAESDSLLIGDPLALVLTIQAPKGVTIKVPSVEAIFESQNSQNPDGDYLELLEVSDLQSRETSDFNVFEQSVTITAWNEGIYTFPSLAFIAETGSQTDSFFSAPLAIRSKFPTPVTGDSSYVADIKPVLSEPTYWSDYLIYLWIVLGATVLGIGIFFLVKVLRQHNRPIQVPISPEEHALLQLDKLLKENPEAEALHANVSFILRQYIGNRYGIAALEASTAETMAQINELKNKNPLKPYAKAIEEVLHTADLVKFAKASPLTAANVFAVETTHKIIGLYVEEKTIDN